MHYKIQLITFSLIIGFFISCNERGSELELQIVSSSDKQWTGVALSKEGRIFVNYPKWSDDVPVSVAEIVNGKPLAFPGDQYLFVAVQSVVIDKKNRLWILDTRNPQFQGVLDDGPVLYQFNLQTNSKENAYQFPKGIFQPNSYFNDVRIDTQSEMAYMTDSGNGALIVLDLKTGKSRRVLDHHPSTESEVDYLMCDGIKWENSVHSDGIALSPDRKYIYYIALTGHTLYRIPTGVLNDFGQTEEMLAAKVERVASVPATDGIMFDKQGNLWMGGLEDNSLNLMKKDGSIRKVIKDEIIRWADSFAIDNNGNVYFTTSQIHLPEDQRKQYQVIRLSQ